VARTEFREDLRGLPWRGDGEDAQAWREGRTGYPVVDAAMRQLRACSWMHNRARMIVASFLCKDLLIDWRLGEAHFLRHLVDGDIASNNGGWQWAAGTGTDAQPFFRIFNPVTQGERFDPDGDYVRRFVPELEAVPTRWIHHPWDMPPEVAEACGVTIGEDYPHPIVDHAEARREALEWFERHTS
jgi:deoxyribodipyrimidine photo-lyase